jgi:hypothetical protein
MTGKIFPQSRNTYEDQAEILFEYYRRAAEAIVNEEERIEKEIAVLKERQVQLAKRTKDLILRERLAYGAAVAIAAAAILPDFRILALIVAAVATAFAATIASRNLVSRTYPSRVRSRSKARVSLSTTRSPYHRTSSGSIRSDGVSCLPIR